MLEVLTTNEYTIKDSFTFAEELQSCFDSKLVMVSFDIESLFTNIPLQETVNHCVENLFKDRTHLDNLLKDSFRKLLTQTMSESLILFDQEFYKQHDGISMGLPLEPTIFFFTFLLFRSKHHIEKFCNYSNRQHKKH